MMSKLPLLSNLRELATRVGLTKGMVAAILVAFVVGFALRGGGEPAAETGKEAESGGKVKWWTCAMHPQIQLQDPNARCPICGMELVAVTGESQGDDSPRRLTMSEAARVLAEVKTAPVERRLVVKDVRLVGKVDYDETRVKAITAWVPGRLDRLY
ncbi:MAG: heavy metal-binding domain-containing protein, partial [Planctomycetota bacterium]